MDPVPVRGTLDVSGEEFLAALAAYVNKKGITLRGIYGRRLWDSWEQLLLLLQSGRIDLDWLITHRLPLDEAEAAVELLTGDAGKVLLVPGANRR